jgi:prevent-host-death family protein
MEGKMGERTVGVRQLKDRLSQYLRDVRRGETIVITDRGRPIGRIVPAGQSLEERLHAMQEAGLVHWNGNRLEPTKPVAKVKKGYSVADLLIEDRR